MERASTRAEAHYMGAEDWEEGNRDLHARSLAHPIRTNSHLTLGGIKHHIAGGEGRRCGISCGGIGLLAAHPLLLGARCSASDPGQSPGGGGGRHLRQGPPSSQEPRGVREVGSSKQILAAPKLSRE